MINVRINFDYEAIPSLAEGIADCINHYCELFFTIPQMENGRTCLEFSLPSSESSFLPITIKFEDPFYLTKATLIHIIEKIQLNHKFLYVLSAYHSQEQSISIYSSIVDKHIPVNARELVFIPQRRNSVNNFVTCTTVIRFHSSGNFDLLERALCNVKSSSPLKSEPLVIAQDLNGEQRQRLDDLIKSFKFSQPINSLRMYIDSSPCSDIRSLLLNKGLQKASTRYVRFQDYDDLCTPESYMLLYERLSTTDASIAVGSIYETHCTKGESLLRKENNDWNRIETYESFKMQGNVPLHSYLIDKVRQRGKRIYYFPDMKFMEDYALNLQLFNDETDFTLARNRVYVGDYMQYDDLNTLPLGQLSSNIYNSPDFIKSQNYFLCIRKIIFNKWYKYKFLFSLENRPETFKIQ